MSRERASDDSSARAIALAMITAALMVAQQVGGKATRDALFLSAFEATELPKVMAAAALLSMVAVAVISPLMARFGPARCVPVAFALNGALFVLELGLLEESARWVSAGLYLHFAVLGTTVISGFWSLVNERFDPHTAKRAMGKIAGGATFGGIVGGVLAERVAALGSMRAMLVTLAVVNGLAALGVASVGGKSAATAASAPAERPLGLRALGRVSYLRDLGLLVLAVSISGAIVDYVFKAEVAALHPARDSLLSFFAVFYTATSVLTFVVQALVTARVLERMGVAAAVAALPAAIVLFGALGAAVARAWSAALLRGLSLVLESSLYRSGYELLYTPVAPSEKRSAKAIIDVAFDRLGTALGSGLVLVVLFFGPAAQHPWLLAAAAACAGLAVWVAWRLHSGYVETLAHNLRTGVVQRDAIDAVDALTQRTLAETKTAIDRNALLHEIERLRLDSAGQGDQLEIGPDVEALASRSPSRARAVLAMRPFDARLTAFVVPLLGDEELARPALDALRSIAPKIAGQLIDALLDTGHSEIIRGRLPAALRSIDSELAERGLFAALRDDSFLIRSRAASALSVIQERRGTIAVRDEEIMELVRWELDREQELEHVFVLLGLALDREALKLSLQALRGGDRRLEGTAREYLENVLPADIREKLWARRAATP